MTKVKLSGGRTSLEIRKGVKGKKMFDNKMDIKLALAIAMITFTLGCVSSFILALILDWKIFI